MLESPLTNSPTSNNLHVRDASRLWCEITGTSRSPHRSLFYRLIAKGAIRGVRSGKRILIDADSLKEYLRPRPIQPNPATLPSDPAAGNAAAERLRAIGTNLKGGAR